MKWVKQRLRSKTYWKEIICGVFVILETQFGLLREILGDHYGLAYLLVMLAGFIIRELTKTPVSEK